MVMISIQGISDGTEIINRKKRDKIEIIMSVKY